jgi:preprotein translocase subunit SecE
VATNKDKPVLQKKTAVAAKPVKETKPVVPHKAAAPAASGKLAKPAGKDKKPNAIKRLWRETVGELRKVTWPTPREAWKLTRVVLVVMFLMSAFLGLMDFVFSKLMTLLLA